MFPSSKLALPLWLAKFPFLFTYFPLSFSRSLSLFSLSPLSLSICLLAIDVCLLPSATNSTELVCLSTPLIKRFNWAFPFLFLSSQISNWVLILCVLLAPAAIATFCLQSVTVLVSVCVRVCLSVLNWNILIFSHAFAFWFKCGSSFTIITHLIELKNYHTHTNFPIHTRTPIHSRTTTNWLTEAQMPRSRHAFPLAKAINENNFLRGGGGDKAKIILNKA